MLFWRILKTTKIQFQTVVILSMVIHIWPQKVQFWPILKTSKVLFQTVVVVSMVLHIWPKKYYFDPFSKLPRFSFKPWPCHLQFFKLDPKNAVLARFKNYQYSIADRGCPICGSSYLAPKCYFGHFKTHQHSFSDCGPSLCGSSNLAQKVQFWPIFKHTEA